MIYILLSLGAINAFIPLIIILILIVAAAGLMRGYNIFAMFGIPALLVNARGSFAGKNATASTAAVRKGSSTGAAFNKLGGMANKYGNKGISKATTFGKIYANQLRLAKQSGLSSSQAAKAAYYKARGIMLDNKMKKIDEKLQKLNESFIDLQKSATVQNNKNIYNALMKTQSSQSKGASMNLSFQYNPSLFSAGSGYMQFDTAATSQSIQNVEKILSKGYSSGIDYKQEFKNMKAEYNNYMKNAKNTLKNAEELNKTIKKELSKETSSAIYNALKNPAGRIKMAITAHNIQKNPISFPVKNAMLPTHLNYDRVYLLQASANFDASISNLKATLRSEEGKNKTKSLPTPPVSHYP